jgi:hypothetical protein
MRCRCADEGYASAAASRAAGNKSEGFAATAPGAKTGCGDERAGKSRTAAATQGEA